jgi:hypothetical protein
MMISSPYKTLRAALMAAALLLMSCSDPPVLRSSLDSQSSAPPNSNDPVAAQCQQLRDQIRSNQETQREADTLSSNPQIIAATQAKADQRIEQLRDRLDELDCAHQGQQDVQRSPARTTPPTPVPNPGP